LKAEFKNHNLLVEDSSKTNINVSLRLVEATCHCIRWRRVSRIIEKESVTRKYIDVNIFVLIRVEANQLLVTVHLEDKVEVWGAVMLHTVIRAKEENSFLAKQFHLKVC
jgi:hypothetical protein